MRNNSSKREETGAGICRFAVFFLGQTKVTCVATWEPRGCVTTTVRDGAEPLVVVAQTMTLATTAALEGISNLNCGCFDLVEIFRSRRLGKNGDDARSSISVITNAPFQPFPPLSVSYITMWLATSAPEREITASILWSSLFQAIIFTFCGLWAFFRSSLGVEILKSSKRPRQGYTVTHGGNTSNAPCTCWYGHIGRTGIQRRGRTRKECEYKYTTAANH